MRVIKEPKTYHFHDEWEENYFFNLIKGKCVCLICNSRATYKFNHKNYEADFPPKSWKHRIYEVEYAEKST